MVLSIEVRSNLHLSYRSLEASHHSSLPPLPSIPRAPLVDSWAVFSSFCCLIDFRRGKAGTPIQRHDNGFLVCQAPPWTVYHLRLGR